jgi:hypothetical protein
MDEGDKQIKRNIRRKEKANNVIQGYKPIPGSFLQSIWVRCRSIFPDITDGKFMESELRYVLYCGIILWSLYLLYEGIK